MKFRTSCVFCLALIITTGCNFYSAVDKPKGDAQVLSAARACFDKGDYQCAAQYYSQVSAGSTDQAISEQTFSELAQAGITVTVFINAAIDGGSNGGAFITQIGGAITSIANETTRLAIFHAYQKNTQIADTHIRGLVKFVTASSLTAEILAEDAATPGKVAQSDLVNDPAGCLASTNFLSASCNPPPGKKITTGTTVSLPTATDAQLSGSPTLFMINAALTELNNGINQMQASGSLGSSQSDFANQLLNISKTALVGDAPIYRGTLLSKGIGEK